MMRVLRSKSMAAHLSVTCIIIISILSHPSHGFTFSRSCRAPLSDAFIPTTVSSSMTQYRHTICGGIGGVGTKLQMQENNNNNNNNNNMAIRKSKIGNSLKRLKLSKVKSSLKSWKYLVFALPLIPVVAPAPPANAVMGIPLNNMAKLKEESRNSGEPRTPEERPARLVEPDASDPKYQGNKEQYEMDMKTYQRRLQALQEQRKKLAEETKRILPTNPTSEDDMQSQALALQMLQQKPSESSASTSTDSSSDSPSVASTAPSSFAPPKVNVAAASKTKQKKVLTIKQRAKEVTITTLRYSTLLGAGLFFAKAQTAVEQKRVQKGIEIFESQKAEYFNITGKADSDEDLADELKNLKGNSTDTDDDDDDDDYDDDYDGDRPPRNPTGQGGGGGNGGEGGSPTGGSPSPPRKEPPVQERKADDEDIERMKRLFNK